MTQPGCIRSVGPFFVIEIDAHRRFRHFAYFDIAEIKVLELASA
jgi:hypothetical protein